MKGKTEKEPELITINDVEYESGKLPEELTFELRKPLAEKSVNIASLELREPNAGEYEQYCIMVANGNHAGGMIKLVSLVSLRGGNKDMSVPIAKMIGMRDMREISKYLLDFM